MLSKRINYETVISKARDIDTLSKNLGYEITTLQNLYNSAKKEWQGPAANEFLKKLYALIESMQKTKNKMSKISDSIEETAKEIKEEDDNDTISWKSIFITSPV